MFNRLILIAILANTPLGATMKLISPAFSHNQEIPAQYTCDGQNISPALAWSDVPETTNSFALIVDDPDAPAKVWVHWVVFNIPSTINHLNQNTSISRAEVPFLQGTNDFKTQKWGGPCPPSGTHHYRFTLYALDNLLDLPAGATKEQLLSAMHGHILEQTTLVGTYKKR